MGIRIQEMGVTIVRLSLAGTVTAQMDAAVSAFLLVVMVTLNHLSCVMMGARMSLAVESIVQV